MVNIAVHTIALNEVDHLQRWADSAADADLLMIADTGSTDGTVELAGDLGVEVSEVVVDPWRFDLARNAGLAALPRDIDLVITVDVDEVLVAGWRELLEKAVAEAPEARRFSYTYVWSWVQGREGVEPDVMFTADRCYSRAGWQWHGAVHEVLVPSGAGLELVDAVPAGFRIEHYADNSKSRSNYLQLLELAVIEEPRNPRQRFYLGREYYFTGRWEQARQSLVQYLAMPEARWVAERAEAYRLIAKMDDHPERWLLRALAEDPARRDAMVDLVDLYEGQERVEEAAGMAARALGDAPPPGDYMTTAAVWDDARLRRVVGRVSEQSSA
jgi:glycosyltransferase involved in cell wall biosynthesis